MKKTLPALLTIVVICAAAILSGCGTNKTVQANTGSPNLDSASAPVAGVIPIERKNLSQNLTVSAELVPFQQIDIYAKEAGYVKSISVDYGTRVRKGQIMAVLEIPELQAQLKQDEAVINNQTDQVTHAEHELSRIQATHRVQHLQYERLAGVAKSQPGLVAQQEVDDAQGKDLAAEAQVEAANANLQAIRNELLGAQAKKEHDKVLLDYSIITAPFAGVVTERYANLGTLMQAGTNSSTQALPLVRLSQDDLFRLVIPVAEGYVRYVHIGDPVSVSVPSLGRTIPGKVARFSTDVNESTRTMHTEVDVPNPNHVLIPGMYADATILLQRANRVLTIPLQAVNHDADQDTADLVDSTGHVQIRKIKLGLETPGEAEVISGLEPGDLVIVSDRSGIKAGELVKPQRVQQVQYPGEKE
ncbi:MAG: efflux RND transporter periplasmic adaptor subunit [Acidobacteriaceae bacterium]|nr:efflux RND transporter periplasmic adaptor subunit [Acidobacteriaceae bacterium]